MLRLGFLLFLLAGAGGAAEASPASLLCGDKKCFAWGANECRTVRLVLEEKQGTMEYAAKDCVFTKTMVRLQESEEEEMKRLLTGKKLSCKYKKGEFDVRWVISMLGGLKHCEGELKDITAKLLIFTGNPLADVLLEIWEMYGNNPPDDFIEIFKDALPGERLQRNAGKQ